MNTQARDATQAYHEELYSSKILFQKDSSWLETPKKEIISLVERNFLGKKNITALDLGSGVGRNAIPIAQMIGKYGGRVRCVDYLHIAIDRLVEYTKKYHVRQFIDGVVSPIEDFFIQPDTYDFIIAHSVLSHVENKEKMIQVMKNMAQGIRKNGIVYIYLITNTKEFDTKSGNEQKHQAEVDISFTKASSLLKSIFRGWKIQALRKEPYEETFIRRSREILWKVDYLLFVAKLV